VAVSLRGELLGARCPARDRFKVAGQLDSFGVYEIGPQSRREQVGFARVVSDRATFAYLADVFVLTEHRGQGLSKRLLETVLAHPELRGLRRWLLFTADAHTLYGQFGFVRTMYPERIMEIRRPYIGDQ